MTCAPARPIGAFDDVAGAALYGTNTAGRCRKGRSTSDMVLGDVSLGSLSSAFDDAVRGSILAEVEKLPQACTGLS